MGRPEFLVSAKPRRIAATGRALDAFQQSVATRKPRRSGGRPVRALGGISGPPNAPCAKNEKARRLHLKAPILWAWPRWQVPDWSVKRGFDGVNPPRAYPCRDER